MLFTVRTLTTLALVLRLMVILFTMARMMMLRVLLFLLEIIHAYKRLNGASKRSVIFTVVTGEESGLLGSDYFASNPVMPISKMVANLAIDMPFFFHPVLDIVPYGADHSSLSKQVDKARKILGLGLSPDPFPEQVVFIRSDHYSFIKKAFRLFLSKAAFRPLPAIRLTAQNQM